MDTPFKYVCFLKIIEYLVIDVLILFIIITIIIRIILIIFLFIVDAVTYLYIILVESKRSVCIYINRLVCFDYVSY